MHQYRFIDKVMVIGQHMSPLQEEREYVDGFITN